MNIVICGAGEVGRHSAEVLARNGHSITIIDQSPARLAEIDDAMDAVNKRFGGRTLYYADAMEAQKSSEAAPMRIAFNHIPDLELERDQP